MINTSKNIAHKWKFVFLVLFVWGVPTFAQLQVSGFVDSYQAIRIDAPNDFLSSRNRVRLEANTYFDNTNLFISFNAMQNYIMPDQTSIELREAWFDYTSDNWDLRIGRQIIIWGKADGLRITDFISPYNLSEFLAQDYDDIRMPVDAVRFRFLMENMDIELIWLPIFQQGILPEEGSPWMPKQSNFSEFDVVKIQEQQLPEKTIGNGEFGGKISFYLPGIDFSLSTFYTWNDFPIYNSQISDDSITVNPEFYRYAFIGADFSASLADFVVRGEAAYYFNEKFDAKNPRYGIYNRNSIAFLLGLDWYPGNDWTIIAQISDDLIMNYHKQISDNEQSWLSTINISKSLFRNRLKLSTFAYIGFDGGELFNRSSINYSLTDELHLLVGFDFFDGNNGMFGQYKDNNEIWMKAKYSF